MMRLVAIGSLKESRPISASQRCKLSAVANTFEWECWPLTVSYKASADGPSEERKEKDDPEESNVNGVC